MLKQMFPIRDSIPSHSVPVATRLLVLVNAMVFILQLTLSPESLQQMAYLFGIVPARFTHQEWAASVGFPVGTYWPVLTHQFLHGGWLHVISNMWALWIFGDNVEDRMGSVRFTIFYLVCGSVAGLVHIFINPDSVVPTVGASGAIAGVLGAYLMFFPTSRILVLFPIFIFPLFFEVPAVLYLVIWFLTQLFSGTLSLAGPARVADIAWWAHIGGFICGMILCWVFARRSPSRGTPYEATTEWMLEPRDR
jgi:rhomboid family protein